MATINLQGIPTQILLGENTQLAAISANAAATSATAAADSAATIGTTLSTGTSSIAGGVTISGMATVLDGTPMAQAGTLNNLKQYFTATGIAIPMVCKLNTDGVTIDLVQLGTAVAVAANAEASFPDFTPDVTTAHYVGFITDETNVSYNNSVAGKAVWQVGTGGQVPGTAVTKTILTDKRLAISYDVTTGTRGQAIKNATSARFDDFAVSATPATYGLYPATDGTSGYGGGYTVMARAPSARDGFVTSASVYLAAAGTGYVGVYSRNANGKWKLEYQSATQTFTAGANTVTGLFLPIRAGHVVGFKSSSGIRIAAGGSGGYYYLGDIGADTTVSIDNSNTARIGYQVTGLVTGGNARALAGDVVLQAQFDGALITQGSTVDGAATVGSGGLTLFSETAVSENGLLETVYFGASASGVGKIVLATKNGSNQFTFVDSIDVSFVAGVNSVATPWRDIAGSYIGFYCASARQRYTSSGGPGARWTDGIPGTNTASTPGAGWLLALGWDIQTGTNPRIADAETRIDALEAAAAEPSAALIYREPTPLATPLASASIYAVGYYGQSNSADVYQGTTPSAVLTATQLYDNVMYSGGALVDLVSVTTERSNVTAANYVTAKRLKDDGTAPTQVMAAWTAGIGGASISALQSGSTGYNNYLARLNEIKALQPSVQPILNMIQGETDTEAGMTSAAWSGHMTTLRTALEASINASTGRTDPLYCVLTQPAWKVALSDDVVLAQFDLAQTDPKFFLNCPMYRMPYSSDDSIHLTNVGFKLLGAYNGKANAAIVRGEKPQWLNPISATYDGATIILRFDVPVQPLVLDTTNLATTLDSGFKVTDNGVAATISSIVAGPDTVTITCSASFTGPVVVRYALDYLGAGLNITSGASGNLRDSDPETITISGTSYQLFNAAPHFEMTAVNVAV